jgi:hypothetical protein
MEGRSLQEDGTGGCIGEAGKTGKSMVSKSECKVKVNDVISSSFETKVVVRQGDTLSPLLFNIFINGIVQKVKNDGDGGELAVYEFLYCSLQMTW